MTTRDFNQVFSRRLWRYLKFTKHNKRSVASVTAFENLLSRRWLDHVRELRLHPQPMWHHGLPYVFNLNFQLFLKRTPHLEVLRYVHLDNVRSNYCLTGLYSIKRALLTHGTLILLTELPKLKTLRLAFEPQVSEPLGLDGVTAPVSEEDRVYRSLHVPHFADPQLCLDKLSGLECLEIKAVWGDLEQWKSCLLKIFINNPRLRRWLFNHRDWADATGDLASQKGPRFFYQLFQSCTAMPRMQLHLTHVVITTPMLMLTLSNLKQVIDLTVCRVLELSKGQE